MAIYLKKFENHTQYENYINGSGAILPNVSICTTEGDVHYNPYVEPVETRVVAKFNVTDISNPTQIIYEYADSPFSAIEIDGVVQPNVVSAYRFDTIGEHTVKYTLSNPTSIGSSAFAECSSLTNVTIPNSVTSIGEGAFGNCYNLTSINIPSGVTSIGDNAFGGTSLTSINIPNGVTSIGNYTFDGCSGLTSVTIGSVVTSIGDGAFNNCESLTSINIPNTLISIGYYAFCGCNLLDAATVAAIEAISEYAFWCD